jgi:hypothetical protein
MSPKDLEANATRLLAAARVSNNPARQQMLVSEALALIKRARSLRDGAGGDAEVADAAMELPPTDGYRLWFDGPDGESLWIALHFATRSDALWGADALAAACADCYEKFELWERSALLYSGDTKHSVFSLKTSHEVSRAGQQTVLDTEEFLRSSRLAIARSNKLLVATGQLRRHVSEFEVARPGG